MDTSYERKSILGLLLYFSESDKMIKRAHRLLIKLKEEYEIELMRNSTKEEYLAYQKKHLKIVYDGFNKIDGKSFIDLLKDYNFLREDNQNLF